MKRMYEICNKEFDTNSSTRIYCYECSEDSTRKDNNTMYFIIKLIYKMHCKKIKLLL